MKKLFKSMLAVLLAMLLVMPLAMPASAGPTMGMGGPETEIPTIQQFVGVFIGGAVLALSMFGLLRSEMLTGSEFPVLNTIIGVVLWMLLGVGVVLAALGTLGLLSMLSLHVLTPIRDRLAEQVA